MADDFQNLDGHLKGILSGILAVWDSMDDKQKLEGQVKELQDILSRLHIQIQEESDKFDAAKAKLPDYIASSQALIKDTEAKVKNMLDKADIEYARILANANTGAEDIKFIKLSDKHQSDLNVLLDTIKNKTQELYGLAAEVDANSVKLKNMKDQIAKFKENL